MHEHTLHEHPEDEHTQSRAESQTPVRCSFCDQPVPPSETTQLHVGDTHSDPVCVHCASSLFEDIDIEQLTGSDTRSSTAGEDAGAASDVTWTAQRPTQGGITGYLLQYHYLSLSLLWSIHQTNVRLFEQFLAEVDTDLLLVLGLVGVVLLTSL